MNNLTLTNEDVARLHGCVMACKQDTRWKLLPLWGALVKQEEVLRAALAADVPDLSEVNLTIVLECVYDTQLFEMGERRSMTDAKMLLARYEYAGKLESLRVKLSCMIKG